MLDAQLIGKDDLALFKVTDDVAEACAEIANFYRNYHSSRYVKDDLVVRVKHPVTAALLQTLNDRFAGLCTPGGQFRAAEGLPEEENEPDLAGLHRVAFPFSRSNFGRLRSLIDVLNQH